MKNMLTLGFGRQPKVIPTFSSVFLLVGLITSYLPKKSLLASLIVEIAIKKTLKLGFGKRPQHNFNFVLNIFSSLVNIKLHT